MRKKDENLRNIILDLAREIISTAGPEAVNIRKIAEKAGIATGTIYNYYAGKDEILLALTEEYWRDTLLGMNDAILTEGFCNQLEEIYRYLNHRIRQSGGMLMGSLHNVEKVGRERMQAMQQQLGKELLLRMAADQMVRKDLWNETFTKVRYVDFIIMNLMLSLQMHADNIDFFIEIIKRTLY